MQLVPYMNCLPHCYFQGSIIVLTTSHNVNIQYSHRQEYIRPNKNYDTCCSCLVIVLLCIANPAILP